MVPLLLVQGSASHIAIHTTEIMTLRTKINELYAHHTGQSAHFVGERLCCKAAASHLSVVHLKHSGFVWHMGLCHL